MNTKALHRLTYGLYIICSKKGEKFNGQVANTVVQTSSEPPTISVCVNKGNLTHQYIRDSGVFTVSVLGQDTPLSFIGQFGFKSGRDINKFEGVNYRLGETGAPIVQDHALAYMEARVIAEMDVGTHTDFLGQLVGADILKEGEPMTYAYYLETKRGTTPKSAPSYIVEEKKEAAKVKMAKYECTACGYIYDPEIGDPDGGVAAGTAFENLPDSWVCPVCGAAKSDFRKIEG